MPRREHECIVIGQVIGRWTVIAAAPRQGYKRMWLCRCECGTVSNVRDDQLKSRTSGSCGCLYSDSLIKRLTTHDLSRSPEYRILHGIIQRCCNPSCKLYARYGAKGIRVCQRWQESWIWFLVDVGPRPGPEYSIDRYPDGSGDYEPGNVRWATIDEQARNRKSNRILEYNGESHILADWSRIVGIGEKTIQCRLDSGWSVEEALTLPPATARRAARVSSGALRVEAT